MTQPCLSDIVLLTLGHDFFRYLIGAGGVYLIVNVGLSNRLSGRKIRRHSPGWRQTRRELLASLRTVLIFALNGILLTLAATEGYLDVYDEIAAFGWVWLGLSIGLIIVLHDAYFSGPTG